MVFTRKNTGFTIVELLIVIVVIAILAAITIVAYTGLTKQASGAAIDAKLTQAAKKVESYRILNGDEYPSDLASLGLGDSYDGYTYKKTTTGYCLSGTDTAGSFRIKNGGKPEPGKCELEGIVTTMATSGDGIGFVHSIAFDAAGNMYLSQYYNYSGTDHKITKMTPSGVVSQFAGSGTPGLAEGQGAAAKFFAPEDVEIDKQGNIYVADFGNSRIRKITPSGVVSTLVGAAGQGVQDGSCATAGVLVPEGLAFDANGDLYFTDAYSRIRKITMSSCTVSTVAGPAYATMSEAPILGDTDGSGTAARFDYPRDIEYGPDGNFYISEAGSTPSVRKMTPSGQVTTIASSGLSTEYGLTLAIDGDGTIYRANDYGENVKKITPTGTVTTFVGSSRGYLDGTGTNTQFYRPQAVEFAANGNLYVADTYNHLIRIVR